MRLEILLVGTVAALCTGACPALGAPSQRPNFVVIVFDDLGYGDLGAYGSSFIETPNVDRVAAEGTRFTHFYVNSPSCTPSRAALLTGRHPVALGMRTNVQPGSLRALPLEVPTLAELLKPAGYATGHFGKWHLGNARFEDLPNARGFDRSVIGLRPGFVQKDLLVDSSTTLPLEDNLTEVTTLHALAFLEAHRDEPFLLNVWYHTPHKAWRAPQRWLDRYPATDQGAYAAMVSHGDEQVGRLLARIEELGLDARTLVLVASDNGPVRSLPSPLSGRKWDLYEGGIRVPLLARWPGSVPAGRVEDGVVAGFDLVPTLLELAQVPGPLPAFDGQSLAGVLRGTASPPRRTLVWESGVGNQPPPGPPETWNRWAVMQDGWKLVRQSADGPPELYDLGADPTEEDDLAVLHPDLVERLTREYAAWRRRTAILSPGLARVEGAAAVEGPWYEFGGGGAVWRPSSGLRVDDGDLSFQARIWPERVKGARTIAEQPGSWTLRSLAGRLQLEVFDRSGQRFVARGWSLLSRDRPADVAFTVFGRKGSDSQVRLYLDAALEDEIEIDALALSDAPLRLGLDAEGTNPFLGTLWGPALRRNALLPEELADRDGDGIANADDLCIGVPDAPSAAGAAQDDVDADGFGDACDADFDGDGRVGTGDWLRLSAAYGSTAGSPTYDRLVDLDGDGRVGFADYLRVSALLHQPVGPSGVACAGELLCYGP